MRDEGLGPCDPYQLAFMTNALARAQDDIRCQRAFSELGSYLGIGISNMLHAFNPQPISMGGTIAQAAPWILPEIGAMVRQRAMASTRRWKCWRRTLTGWLSARPVWRCPGRLR